MDDLKLIIVEMRAFIHTSGLPLDKLLVIEGWMMRLQRLFDEQESHDGNHDGLH